MTDTQRTLFFIYGVAFIGRNYFDKRNEIHIGAYSLYDNGKDNYYIWNHKGMLYESKNIIDVCVHLADIIGLEEKREELT